METFPKTSDTVADADVAIVSALPAGAAIIGKVGIDQSTPGTTDAVTLKAGGVAGAAPSNATSTAYATNKVIKASAGTLYGMTVHNSLGSAQFIQLHDATALPADASVPAVVISVPASTSIAIDFGVYGRKFTTGIVVCNSSTGPTKTIGAADCWFDAQYA